MALGPRIAELRKARGWTQAELAKRAQVSASAVAMYETGRRVPDAAALQRLAQALGVSPEALAAVERTENPAASAAEVAASAVRTEQPERAKSGAKSRTVPRAAQSTGRRARAAQDDLAALALTREEAGIILFLRANPACLPFIESYIRADAREREQLARAWRLIRDFQSYSARPDRSS